MVTRRPRSPLDTRPDGAVPDPFDMKAPAPESAQKPESSAGELPASYSDLVSDGGMDPRPDVGPGERDPSMDGLAFNQPAATPAPAPGTELAKKSAFQLAIDALNVDARSMEKLTPSIEDLTKKYPATYKFDVATKAGMKLADKVRADARKIRLDIKGKRDVGTKAINGLKSQLWALTDPRMEALQAIEDNAKEQIEAHEAIEAARIQRHKDAIAAIAALVNGLDGASSDTVAERMTAAEAIIVDDSYEEFRGEAESMMLHTRDTLSAAFAAANAREIAVAEESKRRAELAAQLDEAREAQEAVKRAKARIQTIRELPGQLEGTGVENIRHALRIHQAAVPDAAHYGDMLDMAEMAHELTTHKLQSLLAEAVKADATQGRDMTMPLGAVDVDNSVDKHAQDDGAEVLAPQDTPEAPAPAPAVDNSEPDLFTPADAIAHGVRDLEPAAAPVTIGSIPPGTRPSEWRSVGRAPIPRGTVAPAPTPAPTAAPQDPDMEPVDAGQEHSVEPEDETPDLLAAAKAVVRAYQQLKAPGFNSPMSSVMHGEFAQAMTDLTAAVDFLTEFAD